MASVSVEFILLATVTNVYAGGCFYEYSYYNRDGEIKYHSDYISCGAQPCCDSKYSYCCPREENEVNLNAVIFGSIFGVTILLVCCGVIFRCGYKKSQQPTPPLMENPLQNSQPGETNQADIATNQTNIFALPPPSYEECVIKRNDTTEAATYPSHKDQATDLQESTVAADGLPEYKELASLGIVERPTNISSTNSAANTPTVTPDNHVISHSTNTDQTTYL